MARLHLALDPLLPLRAPARGEATLAFGYRLRLPDGPALGPDDPLLGAFGARVVDVHVDEDAGEPLQHAGFDPGRVLRLLPDADRSEWVEVWDEEGLRRAGTLTTGFEATARAALDHGLPLRALALEEGRRIDEDRRTALRVLVHLPDFVEVDAAPEQHPHPRPASHPRRRLVLFADGRGEVRWWDPTATGGPVPVDDVPVSPDLARELDALRTRAAAVQEDDDWLHELLRSEVDDEAVALWRRVRAELGRGFTVGFLGRGMRRPVWAPSEIDDDEE